MSSSIDVVITYVDGLDPLWQKDYEKALNVPVMEKRFRDWGTLKYLLRGIETHMPFIENVHLVVARDSQVPSWVNRDVLKVVLHQDIIPSEHLPTFNSTTIEMFLHKIPGLAERYLYFNDDIFPVSDCSESDFYIDGRTAMGFSTCLFSKALYKRQVKNGYAAAAKALGMKPGLLFKRPQHTCSPMQKSLCEELYQKIEPEIMASLSQLRTPYNMNQHMYLNYMYLSGKAVSRRIDGKFFSMALASPSKIADFIIAPAAKLLCVNDVNFGEEKFISYRNILLEAFQKHFPNKSRFEL